ncbi:MAG: ATP-binding protein [Oscillatoria sp. PMC 1051.18]|nr:ATP-binding protein [Oscillatoria sp. PMC 1051.18]
MKENNPQEVIHLNQRLGKYRLIEELYLGKRTVVYRGVVEDTTEESPPVVLKWLRQEYPTFNDLLQFRNQYAIAKNLKSQGIVRPYSLETYGNSYLLVMEDFGGISLRNYIKTNKLSRLEILEIATQQKIPPETREESIFELVNQLNYGTALINEQKERDELSELNLIACHKARSSTAYQAGREYAKIGFSLLGEKAWSRKYYKTLEFHELAAELALLCGDFEEMERFVKIACDRANSLVEKVKVYRLKIQARFAQNQLTEAINIALELLQQLGVTFPESPTQNDIQQAIAEIYQLIGDREVEDLIHLPQMTDAKKIAIIQIANSISPATYFIGSSLNPLLIALVVKESILFGNTPASAFGYAGYAFVACNPLQDVDTGVKFGRLALQITSQPDAKPIKPGVLTVVGALILHRKSHVKESLLLLQEGYATALEVGDPDIAGHNSHNFCLSSFWCGRPLVALEQEASAYCDGLLQIKQLITANYCRIYWQAILNLLGKSEHLTILAGEAFQETEFMPQLLEARDFYGIYICSVYKLMLCYLFEELEAAKNHALEVEQYFMAGMGTLGEPAFYLYDSLTILASLNPELEPRSDELKKVEKNQTKLQQQWANYAPMNHQHKVDLVAAEKCRVLKQKKEASELYDKAISGAKENEYIQEEALANELAAKFYLDWGRARLAQDYMIEAYYCYARWGAKAKVADLEKRYPQLLAPILQQNRSTLSTSETIFALGTVTSSSLHTSNSSASVGLDLAAILKASQTLSSEIQLDKLLSSLLSIVIENAGADKCVLMLLRDDRLLIKGSITLGAEPVVLQRIPVEQSHDVPLKLIYKVKHNLQTEVLSDASTEPTLAYDSYIQQHQPQSVLCSPILHQGKLMGILYLENNLTMGAFTRDRVELLNLLCAQAAISLENARLYERSQEYSQQLEQALNNLKNTQLQLVQSEKMSALGNLVAGVAHEINNPVGFISGNVSEAIAAVQDFTEFLSLYQEKFPNPGDEIADKAEELEIEYLLEDLPKMLASMQVGCERIKGISTSLRTFSRADKNYKVPFNIHEGIESTLLILKHRLKANEQRPGIVVVRNYGDLPQVMCFPGQLNQVFMNVLANAIEALDESNMGKSFAEIERHPRQIFIQTSVENEKVQVIIADNGTGMNEQVKQKIFDHLFTTKAVGKGTGLGLAIAKSIIVEKHGGEIMVNSRLGEGTQFIISFPIKG